jgi:hypothetical protein
MKQSLELGSELLAATGWLIWLHWSSLTLPSVRTTIPRSLSSTN